MTELLRAGARQLLQQTIEAEVARLLADYAGRQDERGRAAVVRNGYLSEREVRTEIRPVPAQVPKVRSRNQESVVFRASLVPPYVRRAMTPEAVLPWLDRKGISRGQVAEALAAGRPTGEEVVGGRGQPFEGAAEKQV